MGKTKPDKNLRKNFTKDTRKLKKKRKREEKIKATNDARALITINETSKVGTTYESKMKNPKKKKDPDEDWISLRRAGG